VGDQCQETEEAEDEEAQVQEVNEEDQSVAKEVGSYVSYHHMTKGAVYGVMGLYIRIYRYLIDRRGHAFLALFCLFA